MHKYAYVHIYVYMHRGKPVHHMHLHVMLYTRWYIPRILLYSFRHLSTTNQFCSVSGVWEIKDLGCFRIEELRV